MNPYTNAVRHKTCSLCGLSFGGDGTVSGELCPTCNAKPSCRECDNKVEEVGDICVECQEKE